MSLWSRVAAVASIAASARRSLCEPLIYFRTRQERPLGRRTHALYAPQAGAQGS
jgi:hypothetical protein